jgi:hypothetical protein
VASTAPVKVHFKNALDTFEKASTLSKDGASPVILSGEALHKTLTQLNLN